MSQTSTGKSETDAELKTLLSQAIGHINRGDAAQCEACLARALQIGPENADAHQLMGVLRAGQTRFDEAETHYRKALAANPGLAYIHNNYGHMLANRGRLEEAVAALREAVRLKPNYADAYVNLGMTLSRLRNHAEAETCYRQALRAQPNYLLAKQCLASCLIDLRRLREAESIARQALGQSQRDPRQSAGLAYTLGLSLAEQRRNEEALAFLEHARQLVPDIPFADYVRGNVFQRLGRTGDALAAYRAAIARDPADMKAHRELNQLLYRQGDDEEFLASYDRAEAANPHLAPLALDKASFLLKLDRFEEAYEAFARGARLDPAIIAGHDGQGLALAGLARFDEAIAAHEAGLRLEPENGHAWCNFALTLLRAGDAKKALKAAEKARAIEPDNQHGLAIWGLALRALDDGREETLNDYAQLVQVFDLEPPQGFSDMESFNHALNAQLDGLHRDKREFLDQTLRGGTQTIENIFGVGHNLVEKLRARIDEAVSAYIQRMNDDESHPLSSRKRDDFLYRGAWSSRLHDNGYHTNHVHPMGWISSCYYVAVPGAASDETAMQGWIKFGEPPYAMPFPGSIRRSIRPVPGRLVLFPSYMWHGTVPFRSDDARTTIAFDAVPA